MTYMVWIWKWMKISNRSLILLDSHHELNCSTYLIDGVSSKESISEKAAEKSEEESCGHVIGYNGGSSVRRKMHESGEV
ncbi:hypothetical protein PanWU01x14_333480 [Parasponia andersonii]|uniref:Uncharacterized protein n=1 Tax=Parasponia andersonii TaxID=3476 RepID=A0A2P5AGW7_PARAD|nr:hypothetical protein PanWU01x14_333480 [Parasponia andersonii]